MIDAGHTHASGNICRLLMMFTNMKRDQCRLLNHLVPPGSAAESLARHQSRIHRPRRTAVQDRRTRRRSCPTLMMMMMMTGWDLHLIETLVRCLGMLISHTQGAILHFSADDEGTEDDEDSTQAGTGPQGGAPSVPIVPPPRAHRQLPLMEASCGGWLRVLRQSYRQPAVTEQAPSTKWLTVCTL